MGGPDGYLSPVQFLDHLTVIKRHFSEQVKQSDDFEGQFYVYTLLWVISCTCTQGDREKATLVCRRRYLPFVYLSSELNGKWAISTWNFFSS